MMVNRTSARPRSIDVGNAGEQLVLARLLARGHCAALTSRNSPAFDIITRRSGRYAALRVKSSRDRCVQWSAKADGSIFLDRKSRDRTDFVIFALNVDGDLTDVEFYVVPAALVERTIRRNFAEYLTYRRRRGITRERTSGHRAIWFSGSRRRSRGYAERWKRYREAWHLLEGKRKGLLVTDAAFAPAISR
jgi:hypothetical protein